MSKNNLIYAVFKRLLQEARHERSAGVVIFKKSSTDPLFLALVKDDGKYDITKGIIEPGEEVFDCAVREAEEESGIVLSSENFRWGMVNKSYGRGTAYIAETDVEPSIMPNPETGVLEHTEAKWVTFDEMLENVSDFLIPAINWAYNIKMGNPNVNI